MNQSELFKSILRTQSYDAQSPNEFIYPRDKSNSSLAVSREVSRNPLDPSSSEANSFISKPPV